MENAAKAASVYDTIMGFPDKFDTRVGERGLRLSGGEKQRVAIARTILKNPKVVILDEATSALGKCLYTNWSLLIDMSYAGLTKGKRLDTHTEHRIQDALERVCQGRTTLIIAHRLSTIIHSHSIAVLKDGYIAEIGSHSDLLARPDGLYACMWQAQQQEREASDGSIEAAQGEGPGQDKSDINTGEDKSDTMTSGSKSGTKTGGGGTGYQV
jgi:ABC-type transport system involved in cytochrome bd biosynthesis fused ATPase/permease subunit